MKHRAPLLLALLVTALGLGVLVVPDMDASGARSELEDAIAASMRSDHVRVVTKNAFSTEVAEFEQPDELRLTSRSDLRSQVKGPFRPTISTSVLLFIGRDAWLSGDGKAFVACEIPQAYSIASALDLLRVAEYLSGDVTSEEDDRGTHFRFVLERDEARALHLAGAQVTIDVAPDGRARKTRVSMTRHEHGRAKIGTIVETYEYGRLRQPINGPPAAAVTERRDSCSGSIGPSGGSSGEPAREN